ncbi:MAG TPA: sigma 54-interacting transcriptional regulator [Deltaproteobacteria bacterium]|nr:sigma 54-interacting transcriptional regulator [Deltaproteobacteria bacterium]HPR54806.1 sigma 54-interacting transcriptional regulator [Deltaproteobacteria bacterium]
MKKTSRIPVPRQSQHGSPAVSSIPGLGMDSLLENILNSANFGLIAADREGRVTFVNLLARIVLGFEQDTDQHPVHIFDVDPELWNEYLKILSSGEAQLNVPARYNNNLLVSHRLPIVEDGDIVGVMSIFKHLEAYEELANDIFKLKEYTHEIEAIIESSYDGIYVTDGEANTIRVNSAYEKITGMKASELVGRNMEDLVMEGYFDESVSLKVREQRKPVTIRQTLKSGKSILVTGNPIFDENGGIKMIVTNVRDMTDLVELQQQLEYSKGMTSAYRDILKSIQQASVRDNAIIMVSEPMLHIQELLERVRKTNATVLIYGETGVGKDRIAEEIHEKSERSDSGIFVKINCGAIPETLLESELFGYERGAFTGARKEGKSGLFEVAHKGTLFLDEVESMPMVLQSKLLRVLQNFEITRVGGTKPVKVDVRLICASNQDLKDLIAKKLFRADLYYRLNVIPIYIPPLRERRDDIPYLVHFFLNRYNKRHGTRKAISREAMDHLLTYSWPGNVREVANVIERLVVITQGDYIVPGNLPREIFEKSTKDFLDNGLTLKEQMEKIETSIIRKAIEKYGSARKAAPHLGMDSTSLTRKLKRYS